MDFSSAHAYRISRYCSGGSCSDLVILNITKENISLNAAAV